MPATALPTIASLQALAPLEPFTGFGGVTLKVNRRSWPIGTPTATVLDNSAIPELIVATQDGRRVNDPLAWHRGPEGEVVYYERYTIVGGVLRMSSHGYVDAYTRQLVQAG